MPRRKPWNDVPTVIEINDDSSNEDDDLTTLNQEFHFRNSILQNQHHIMNKRQHFRRDPNGNSGINKSRHCRSLFQASYSMKHPPNKRPSFQSSSTHQRRVPTESSIMENDSSPRNNSSMRSHHKFEAIRFYAPDKSGKRTVDDYVNDVWRDFNSKINCVNITWDEMYDSCACTTDEGINTVKRMLKDDFGVHRCDQEDSLTDLDLTVSYV